jgi:hypothetical protein
MQERNCYTVSTERAPSILAVSIDASTTPENAKVVNNTSRDIRWPADG